MNKKKLAQLKKNREVYLSMVLEDIAEVKKEIEEKKKVIAKYDAGIATLNNLMMRTKWISLLKLSKRVYVPGTLQHTGEYMVTVKANPVSYSSDCSVRMTKQCLENYVEEELKKHLKLLENKMVQLTERAKLYSSSKIPAGTKSSYYEYVRDKKTYDSDDEAESETDQDMDMLLETVTDLEAFTLKAEADALKEATAALRDEIVTDRGVAIRVGELYEIIEHDE